MLANIIVSIITAVIAVIFSQSFHAIGILDTCMRRYKKLGQTLLYANPLINMICLWKTQDTLNHWRSGEAGSAKTTPRRKVYGSRYSEKAQRNREYATRKLFWRQSPMAGSMDRSRATAKMSFSNVILRGELTVFGLSVTVNAPRS